MHLVKPLITTPQLLSALAMTMAFATPSTYAQKPAEALPSGRIAAEGIAVLLADLTKRPGSKVTESPLHTVIVTDSRHAAYFFTRPQHPAHPAVVMRYATQSRDGKSRFGIGSAPSFAGNFEAFSRWYAMVVSLNTDLPKPLPICDKTDDGCEVGMAVAGLAMAARVPELVGGVWHFKGAPIKASSDAPAYFEGGDGSNCAKAVVIRALSPPQGVRGEAIWMSEKYPGIRRTGEGMVEIDGRKYDHLRGTLPDGTAVEACFDFKEFGSRE